MKCHFHFNLATEISIAVRIDTVSTTINFVTETDAKRALLINWLYTIYRVSEITLGPSVCFFPQPWYFLIEISHPLLYFSDDLGRRRTLKLYSIYMFNNLFMAGRPAPALNEMSLKIVLHIMRIRIVRAGGFLPSPIFSWITFKF
jgi:hypothetical protein